jgi:hypothetical protein
MVDLVLKSEHAAADDTDAVEGVILIIPSMLWRISYKIDIRRHATFVGSYIRSTLKIAMVLKAVIIDMISAGRVEMAQFVGVDHDLMLQRGLPSAFVPVATHVAAPYGLGLGLGLAHFVRVPPR